MTRIITITPNPALDISTNLSRLSAEQKLRCGQPRYEPGGGGINVSRAIHRLGGSSFAITASGGPIGEMFCRLLEKEGIRHKKIPIEGNTRFSFTVLEDQSDQQYRFTLPGPPLGEAEWRGLLDAVSEEKDNAEYIVASGSLPPVMPADFYARLARLARQNGQKLILDTSGDALQAAVKEGVYLLKPNMRELAQLAGQTIENDSEQKSAVKKVIENGQAEVVVVSMGAGGALLASHDGFDHIRAPTVKIRSKIGAGDSMVAGIVLGLRTGRSLGEAVRYGVAAGASAVATPGTELCRKEKTEELYAEMMRRPRGE